MKIDFNKGLRAEDLARPVRFYTIPLDTVFSKDLTLEELLSALRSKEIKHTINYFFVTDDENLLYGVVSTRDILFNHPSTTLEEILDRDVVKLLETETLEDALKKIAEHQLLALPVVDASNGLKGLFEIVPPDVDVEHEQPAKIQLRAARDIFQSIGMAIEQKALFSSWEEYKRRMPWLFCNLFSGIICALIAGFYKAALTQYVILAMFIPLVLTVNESVAMQSMALRLQFMKGAKMSWKWVSQRILREMRATFFLGVTCSVILFLVCWLWHGHMTSFVISSSVLATMMLSASLGTIFPTLINTTSLDVKVASGPVILMVTDIVVTLIYLGLTSWWLLSNSL